MRGVPPVERCVPYIPPENQRGNACSPVVTQQKILLLTNVTGKHYQL
jgi:hypothetical protein